MDLMNSQRKSHTHLQFTQANAKTKNCKRVCLADARGDSGRESTYPQQRTEPKSKFLNKNQAANLSRSTELVLI